MDEPVTLFFITRCADLEENDGKQNSALSLLLHWRYFVVVVVVFIKVKYLVPFLVSQHLIHDRWPRRRRRNVYPPSEEVEEVDDDDTNNTNKVSTIKGHQKWLAHRWPVVKFREKQLRMTVKIRCGNCNPPTRSLILSPISDTWSTASANSTKLDWTELNYYTLSCQRWIERRRVPLSAHNVCSINCTATPKFRLSVHWHRLPLWRCSPLRGSSLFFS